MKPRSLFGSLLALSVLVATAPACSKSSTSSAETGDATPLAPTFEGWTIKSDELVARDKLGPIESRLGAKVKALRNVTYDVGGKTIQVNVIAAPDAAEANKVFASLTGSKPPWATARRGDVLYEFVGQNDAIPDIKKAHDKLARP